MPQSLIAWVKNLSRAPAVEYGRDLPAHLYGCAVAPGTDQRNGRLETALSGAACRAGRALLKWSVLDLAREARVSPNTIVKLENGGVIRPRSAMHIRARFAREGVELLDEPTPGARLRH